MAHVPPPWRTVIFVLAAAASAGAATVTVPGDYPTIQTAIENAPDGSVIQIAPGRHMELLTLDRIARTLTIRGNPDDPNQVVIDGGGANRSTVRVTACGSNVVFEGLTITGGRGTDGYGGGLFLGGSSAIFRRCTFSGNAASADGGGVFVLSSGGLFDECVFERNTAARFGGGALLNVGATTAFNRCEFRDNQAGLQDVVSGWGGALHINDSSPTLVGCIIASNQARTAGGGISITGHFTAPLSVVVLRDTTLQGNTAVKPSANAESQGGGMHIEDNVRAVLERVQIVDNVANSGGGLSTYRARYEIDGSRIAHNQAQPVVPDALGGFGGGLFASSVNGVAPARPAAEVMLTRTAIVGNTAHVGAGAVVQGDFGSLSTNQAALTVADAVIAANVASGRAAGMFIDRTAGSIVRTSVLSNQVTSANNSWGGGLAVIGGSQLSVQDATIAGNVVGELGGGIYVDQGSRLDVSSSRFFGNSAGSVGGAGGGAIAVAQAVGPTPGPVTGTVRDSVLRNNGGNFELWESDCDSAQWSRLVYQSNRISNAATGVYYRNCTGATATVAAFNAIAGKASANVANASPFTSFVAVPPTVTPGMPATLAWSVPGGALRIDPDVGPLPGTTGTTDVDPAQTTTYVLGDGGAAVATATVTVTCPSLGTPIPLNPSNAKTAVPVNLTLAWYPASGASHYDVYLAPGGQPAQRIAADLSGTVVDVAGLVPHTAYAWKVAAKAAACPDPIESPVFTFTTCGSDQCEWAFPFDDGDLSGWTRRGRGRVAVVNGKLHVSAKGKLTLVPPAPSLTTGSATLTLALQGPRRAEAHLMFHHQGRRAYRDVTIRLAGQQWKLQDRSGKRARTLARARLALPPDGGALHLDLTADAVQARIDGSPVLSAPLAPGRRGQFALQVVSGRLVIDDLRILDAD